MTQINAPTIENANDQPPLGDVPLAQSRYVQFDEGRHQSVLDRAFSGGQRPTATMPFPDHCAAARLRGVMLRAFDLPHDDEIVELQRRTGLPPDIIEQNKRLLRDKAFAADFDAAAFRRDSPLVAQWLIDHPDRAAVLAPSILNMSYVERQARHIGQQFQSGRATTELGDIGWSVLTGTVTPEQRARQAELQQSIQDAQPYGIDGFFEEIPGAMANQLPIWALGIKGKIKGAATLGAASAVAAAGATLIAGQAGPQALIPEEAVTVPVAATAAGLWGARIGWGKGGAVPLAMQEAGQAMLEYETLLDDQGEPMSREAAQAAAVIVGAVNGTLELAGMEKLLKTVPGLRRFSRDGMKQLLRAPTARAALTRMGRQIAEVATVEGMTEFMQEAVTTIMGELGLLLDGGQSGPADIANMLGRIFNEENVGQWLEAGRTGMQAGGGMAAVTSTASLASDLTAARQARQRAEAFEQMGKAVQDSDVVARLPDALRQIVEQAAASGDGGGVEHVYIPAGAWTTYWQEKGADPREVARQALGDAEVYDQAVEAGSDIQIPIGVYASSIAPTEHNAFFAQELRTDPTQMNAREALEWAQMMDQRQAEQIEQAQQQNIEQAGKVRQDVLGQLLGAGFEQSAADSYAALYESTFQALGERTGQDPMDLYQRYGLRIVRDLPAVLKQVGQTDALDALVDRLRSGDVLLQRAAAFNQTNLERQILDWAQRHGLSETDAALRIENDEARELYESGEAITAFRGEVPTELREALEERPHLRAQLQPNQPRGRGQDFMEMVGADQYVEILEQLSGGSAGQMRGALDLARTSQDPEALLLSWIHDRLPRDEVRQPMELIRSDQLRAGDSFALQGEQVQVVDRDGDLLLVADGLEVPVWAAQQIPADEGSLTRSIDPGSDVADLAGSPEAVRALQSFLEQIGADLSQMDNQQVRDLIQQQVAPTPEMAVQALAQGAQPRPTIEQVLSQAEPYWHLELTPETWQQEFGDSQVVQTPIGDVKLGENQYAKLQARGREQFFGLIKPTLESPAVILQTDDGAIQFIKSFTKNDGVTLFMSVARDFDGTVATFSSHPLRTPQMQKAIESGRLLYSTALRASEDALPKQPTESDGSIDIISG